MAYEKFITRKDKNGKIRKYGPYLYESVRTKTGRIKTVYLGKAADKKGVLTALKESLNIF